MPECRCRTEAPDYRKKCRCRTNFSPAFRHLHTIFQYHRARITPSTAVNAKTSHIFFSSSNHLPYCVSIVSFRMLLVVVAFHEDLCNFLFFSINKILSAAVYGRVGCITFHYMQFGRALGIPFSTANNSKNFRSQQYGPAGCIPFQQGQYGRAENTLFLNAGISDCPASSQSGTGMNKSADAGISPVPKYGDPVRYRNAPVPDWDTGCRNAGMPMPVVSITMPMPSCARHTYSHVSRCLS